jgi:hypothetical protein
MWTYRKVEEVPASSRKAEQREDIEERTEMSQPGGRDIPRIFNYHSENKGKTKVKIP